MIITGPAETEQMLKRNLENKQTQCGGQMPLMIMKLLLPNYTSCHYYTNFPTPISPILTSVPQQHQLGGTDLCCLQCR